MSAVTYSYKLFVNGNTETFRLHFSRFVGNVVSRRSKSCRIPVHNNKLKANWLCSRWFKDFQRRQSFVIFRDSSTSSNVSCQDNFDVGYISCSDKNTHKMLTKDMKVISNFVSSEEEQHLFNEIEPYLKRLRYETAHWDDAIHGFRETERKKWTEKNNEIIQRVRDVAFPPGVKQISYVHVLDLKKEGYIKPHVDAVKFCGSTIAGICLLSPAVMRLVSTEDKTKVADILLERRSLYIMKDEARYKYTHEVLKEEESRFRDKIVPRDRRISVICRNEP